MNKSTFFLLLICYGSYSHAQIPERAIATIYYTMEQIVDSTQPSSPAKLEMVLYVGKNSSLFTSFDEIKYYERIKNFKITHPDVKIGGHTSYWGAPIYFLKDKTTHILSSVSSMMGSHFLTEEKIPDIKWEISADTKTIQGFVCQKATGAFHGRIYEVWFCNQFPFSNGPWKLEGLPGLIMEAYDTKKEIVWNFKSFEDTSHLPIEIALTTIKTTPKALWRTIEASQSEAPSLPGSGGGIVLTQSSINGATARKKVYNNPIDKEW